MTAPNTDSLPRHVGIIMDGNGRWAQKRNLPRTFGHKEGAEVFKKITDLCIDRKIEYLTLYAFSTENWKRPAEETGALMKLFDVYLGDARSYSDRNVRIVFLGDKSAFGKKLSEKMTSLENDTKGNDGMTLMLAMNYGGRDDIIHAAKKAAELASEGFLKPSDINEELFSDMLYTGNAPDVDLMIRTGGEYRLSNFLIWQCAYAEFWFTDVLWPDFGAKELDGALEAFASRKRRFGGV